MRGEGHEVAHSPSVPALGTRQHSRGVALNRREGGWYSMQEVQGSWKDAQMHLRAITHEPINWVKRRKTIICGEFLLLFSQKWWQLQKPVCTTNLPLPAAVIAEQAACPAVEKRSCREEVAPGSHRLLPQCSQKRGASQWKLKNPAEQVKSFSVLLTSLKCRDKTLLYPTGLGFLDPPWHGFWGINEKGVPRNAGRESRFPVD